MVGVAIVAIPSRDDYVWKISSEKVPHLTLLFLGEHSKTLSTPRVQEFVEHVAMSSMYRFGLSVDRRGLLGDDDADVLFFEKQSYNVKMLETARAYLLGDRDIAEAYHSTEQYPSWTPHLTLGYPKTPAYPDDRDYPHISYVSFDRVALWTGDYEGPEFLLGERYSPLEASMSGLAQRTDSLAHYGVKGMRWGVRRKRIPASDDAVRVGESLKKAKKGGTSALSTKELQELVNRMNLEQQYARIQGEKRKGRFDKGHNFVKTTLSAGRTMNEVMSFLNSPFGKLIRGKLK